MATQLKSKYIGTATGVRTTPVQLMEIPYDSIVVDVPVFCVLRCIGSSNVGGSIKRVFFVIPITWYGNGTLAFSIPTEFDAVDYLSTAYSHLEISDTISGADLLTYNITPNPQTGSGTLVIQVTAPDTATDWEFYAYADIYKEI